MKSQDRPDAIPKEAFASNDRSSAARRTRKDAFFGGGRDSASLRVIRRMGMIEPSALLQVSGTVTGHCRTASNRQWALAVLMGIVLWVPTAAQPSRGLLREVYTGIGGTAVRDLTSAPAFPDSPGSVGYVTDFEAPTDVLDDYGQRLRGYVMPPVSGNYVFWIASDDGGELWLGTDSTPNSRRRIATVNGWTSPREWTREPNQRSAPVPLEAGQIYYVEALMKEGGGGDNLSVRWLRPDSVDEAPIPGAHLLPWGIALREPAVVRDPVSTEVVEGAIARFDVVPDPMGPARFQWMRNRSDLPEKTESTLEYGPVSLADHQARFSVRLTNTFGSVVSAEAVLTVVPDTTRPVLVSVENRDERTVQVRFSKPVASATASVAAHFQLDGRVTVHAAALDPDGLTVRLSVSPLTFGTRYTLMVRGITDQAGTPNEILPDSQLAFVALEYAPADVGRPAVEGGVVRIGPDRYDVTGGGTEIGGSRDEFQFASELRTGDFDLEARIEGVTISNPWVHAGLMARPTLDAGSPSAAVLAPSAQVGCFFKSRSTAGASVATVAPRHGFPANDPFTWLRLRRAGNNFSGFASLDGRIWTPLGSVTLPSAPATLRFGLAVASLDPAATATAQFRDIRPVSHLSEGSLQFDREPPGPFVRSSGMVLTELMYRPRADGTGRDLAFVELSNAGSIVEDLSGAQLTGDISFTFPDGFRLIAGDHVVVAAAPGDLEEATGLSGVLGPYSGRLPHGGGTVGLRSRHGDQLFVVPYGTGYPWPVAANGGGHSLTLARPSYGPRDPRAWAAGEIIGGTPGRPEAVRPDPLKALHINEILARGDGTNPDFIELFNGGPAELDVSGCILTDSPAVARFIIPAGTRLAPRDHLVLDRQQLGFGLSASGEAVYLIHPSGNRVLDAVRFGPQERGVSYGRQPDGSPVVRRLAQPTPGAANASWRREDLVISELMYHPISKDDADEYLELHNRSDAPVALGGWRFTDGIDFEIPEGVIIEPGQQLVVAKDPERLRRAHPNLAATAVVGPYRGTLSNRGERIALSRPEVMSGVRVFVDVAEVSYRDGGAWGEWADGGGSSLELVDVNADPWMASNWADSDETAKGEWTAVSFTGRLDQGNSSFQPNQLQITLQGGGEAQVDDVEVMKADTGENLVNNPGFESGSGAGATGWTFQGNHATSFVENTVAASGTRCLHLKAQARGDTGFNRVRAALRSGLRSGDSAIMGAKVRWVRGWPEVLFRIRGNWIEMPVRLSVPSNLGTPGRPNSRRLENAGPAIAEVRHVPVLPASGEPVVVTAQVADPDGVSAVRLVGRLDGGSTTLNLVLRDDGTGGDAFPGDGIYTVTLPGRTAGTLAAFRIEATDGAGAPATTRFPAAAPARECLVRWGDPVPFGTLGHYHMWSTTATENARNNSSALNNLFRDLTFVYGNSRVVYGAGFKDKGSPFKGGAGDWFIQLPKDEPVLNTDELTLASTGNNGNDSTNLREQLCFTIARDIGASYVHRRYVRLYRNGSAFRDVMEDTEEPNGEYSERYFSDGANPDLYKVEDWFEFQDDGTSFNNVDATLQRFTTPPGTAGAPLKVARYRWNWRKRAVQDSANNYTNLLELVEAVNTQGAAYVDRVFGLVDVDQWMRTFAFQRIVGNWDSYGMARGKNMYAYKRDGMTWKLFSWDVDFALDQGGNSPTDGLWGGGDPAINTMFNNPAIRRRLWQAYLDAVNGPLDPARAAAEAGARAEALRNNGIRTTPFTGALNYLATRRQTILNAYQAADVPDLAITGPADAEVTTGEPVVLLTGRAPLALTGLTVNGVPYPVTWTGVTAWRLTVPLTQATNDLILGGVDRFGRSIPGHEAVLRVISTAPPLQPQDFVVINEIQYQPTVPDASFLELHNTSASTPFDLSGCRLEGLAYTFPNGAILPPGGFLVLAKSRAAFATAYGATLPVYDEFPGNLRAGGERLALVRPDAGGGSAPLIINELGYGSRPPWPVEAAGLGPSLQLVDPRQDNRRPANWAATAPGASGQVTPGTANTPRTALPPMPNVWINEVLPQGTTDGLKPFIELHNAGPTSVDLSSCFLSNTADDLTLWPFPAGTVLGAGQYLVVLADGAAGPSGDESLHTSFRLTPELGVVTLAWRRDAGIAPAALDFLEYSAVPAERSVGSMPDADPLRRRLFQRVTPGLPNDPAVPGLAVTINEFMATNSGAVADPADGRFDDWFELYNAGPEAADLSGYYLTDNLSQWNQFRIPPGYVIPPLGFLVVWADDEVAQNALGNGDLHVNFRLAAAGESIGLFDPNGQPVDVITFGPQSPNVSEGRFPDGGPGDLFPMDAPTPGGPNQVAGGNVPPVLNRIGDLSVDEMTLLNFTATASDANPGQQLTFSLDDGAPEGASMDGPTGVFSWIPTESQGPGSYTITVRVTDNGTPPRSASERLTIRVFEVNRPPVLEAVPPQSVDEGSELRVTLAASDPDIPPQRLTFSILNPPEGASLDADTGTLSWIPTEEQGPGRFELTVRVTDDGEPPLTAERSFQVIVNEADNAPVIVQLPPITILEGQTLVVTNRAWDSDRPPNELRFSLPSGAPPGVTLDPVTGVLVWETTEEDGPSSHLILIRVTQITGLPLSDQYLLGVTILEDNQPPRLQPIADVEIMEGERVEFFAVASDADLPAQALTFSLDPGAPDGAEVDPVTGRFTWQSPQDAGANRWDVTVRVTDDGPGMESAAQTFQIATHPGFQVLISELMTHPETPGAAYIEILNRSERTPWPLGGVQLRGLGLEFTFPDGFVLSPGAAACVVENSAAFRAAHGEGPSVAGQWTGTLNPVGDVLRLWTPAMDASEAEILDEVRFEAAAPWPAEARSGGTSLQLLDLRRDNTRVGNWAARRPTTDRASLSS